MGEQPDLTKISHTLEALARTIRGDEESASGGQRALATTVAESSETQVRARRLRAAEMWQRMRDERDRNFNAELFFEPSWNMLLDLYVSECHRHVVTVSSLCQASKVPMTTALRWIALLERQDLLGRAPDPFDRRRFNVFLTEKAKQSLEATLDFALGLGALSRDSIKQI